MTLKLTRYFTDALKKQATISHFMFPIELNSPDKISSSWKRKILEQYGELFLNDANYIVACKAGKDIDIDVSDIESVEDLDKENLDAVENKANKRIESDDISEKTISKFTDLLETVFGTSIPSSDIKTVDSYLFVKITTK